MRTFFYRFSKVSLVLLFIVVLAAIWFVPHMLGWDADYSFTNVLMQLLLSIILLLVAGFFVYLKYIYTQKTPAEKINEKLASQNVDKEAWQLFRRETKNFYKGLQDFFQHWGQQKKYFLRKLPWYMLLGYTGSGKTSLLSQANLNFFSTEHLPDAAFKDACPHTWRFSNEAVFVEMPFQAIDVPEEADVSKKSLLEYINKDSPFLLALLRFIKRYRRKDRLNGVVVTFNLADFLCRTEISGQEQQQQLKNALHRIHSELQIQTPVYLILTKCDLIAGFREFFADLSKEERDQNWGIAFPKTPFTNRTQALDYFNKEFDALMARLHERLFVRLDAERSLANRAGISYFPQQIAQCKQALADLILQDNTAQMRGIYFCSSLQDGTPLDTLMTKLSAHFNLEEEVSFNNFVQKKSYFSQKLLSQIVLPESGLARSNSKYWQRYHTISDRVTMSGLSAFLLLALTGFCYSWQQNKDSLETIAQYLPIYEQAVDHYVPTDISLISTLPVLDSLKNIQSVYANKSSWLVWLEVFDPLDMQHKIDQAWQHFLNLLLMPRVASRLEVLLQQDQLPVETLYQTLKGYLVFSPAVRANPQWLKPPIRTDLAATLTDKPDEQAALNGYLAEAVQQPVDAITLDDALIAKVRERLRQVPPVQFAYYEIKQEAENSHDQLNLSDSLEPYFSDVFTYQDATIATIPALYTNSGYKGLEGKRSEILIQHTAEIYRILGLNPLVSTDELSMQMTPELWGMYNTDYTKYWQNALANVQVAPFKSLSQGIQTLDTLLDPVNSPMLKLLHILRENTAPVHGQYMHVSEQFSSINAATGASRTAIQYGRAVKTLSALRDYLNKLNNTPNVAEKEFQDASAIMQNNLADNPIVLLRNQAAQLPAPLNAWFTQIADNSMGLLFDGAHQIINAAWKNDILPYYKVNIQGRFPFAEASENSVDMTNFGAFFGSNGIYANYLKKYLAPFINTNQQQWQQYTFGAHSLGLADTVLHQLSLANLVRTMYFPTGDNTPAVQFSIQPRYLDPQASSINITLAGQSMTYRHGPAQSMHWRWPFTGNTQQVGFSFSDFHNENFSRSFDGPWGWFQLLSATGLERTGDPGHYVWSFSQGKYKASFDLWVPNNLPVFDLTTLKEVVLPENI